MFFNSFAGVLQLIASPLFFTTAVVASVFLTVAPVRLSMAQRRLTRVHRLLIEADLAGRCVGPAGKPDRKGRTPRKGLKSGAGQEPGDDEKEEPAGA